MTYPRVDEFYSFFCFYDTIHKECQRQQVFFAVDDLRINHGKMVTLRKRAQK
jgi:hypothetical protein